MTAADIAYQTAAKNAANTLSLAGYTIPNGPGAATNPGNCNPGGVGVNAGMSPNGVIGNGTASMGALC